MSNVTSRSLHDLAAYCGALLHGDGSVIVHGMASIESAKDGDLVFASDEERLLRAVNSRASGVIAGEFAGQLDCSKPVLVARDPKLAFARIATLLLSEEKREGHDESAQIHLSAKIGEHVWIGPGVVIEEHASIGDGSSVGANSVIGTGVCIGQQCHIGPSVTLYSGVQMGDRVVVQAGSVLGSAGFGYVRDEQGHYYLFPQIGRLIVEHDVEIGANCTIDRGALDATVIGRGAKLDNMVHVGHNVLIGQDVVIAAQTGISGSSRIGSGAVVGGQVGIGDHATIEDGVIVGSGSGILTKKVLRGKGMIFWGTPARPLKDYLRELATLARLSRKKSK